MMRLGSCGPRENGTLEETERILCGFIMDYYYDYCYYYHYYCYDVGYHPCFMFTHQWDLKLFKDYGVVLL